MQLDILFQLNCVRKNFGAAYYHKKYKYMISAFSHK